MKNITSKDLLDLLYGKKLPQVYRDEDGKIEKPEKYPLKRYLESLIEGGFYGSIKDMEKMMLLIDPMNIPEEFFPYLCQSLGLEYFPDIDISYQRRILMSIGEVVRRRGTYSCVQFIIRVLTGLNADLSCDGNYLYIKLLPTTLKDMAEIGTSMSVIKRYVQTHLPYYIYPEITYEVVPQTIGSKSYSFSMVQTNKHTVISKFEGNSYDLFHNHYTASAIVQNYKHYGISKFEGNSYDLFSKSHPASAIGSFKSYTIT